MPSKTLGYILCSAIFGLCLWGLSSTIVNYTEEKAFPDRDLLSELESDIETFSNDRGTLKEEDKIALGLKIAETSLSLYQRNGTNKLVFQAIDYFNRVLKINPANPQALLALGQLSLRVGASANATDYFKRYLNTPGADSRWRSDYALSLLQSEKLLEASETYKKLIDENLAPFENHMGLALSEKLQGKHDLAHATASKARDFADTESKKTILENFLKSNKASSSSLAKKVENFFRSSPVIGPKLVKFIWGNEESLVVLLREFPVSKMPEVAKTKLRTELKDQFSGDAPNLKITLVDQRAPEENLLLRTSGEDS